jgi:hypothetical protein
MATRQRFVAGRTAASRAPLIEITAKSRGSLIRRINSLMIRFNSLLGQK